MIEQVVSDDNSQGFEYKPIQIQYDKSESLSTSDVAAKDDIVDMMAE